MPFLYPRLDKSQAILIAENLRKGAFTKYDDSTESINYGSASPKSTGGVPVSHEHLQNIRRRVYESISQIDEELSGLAWANEYDRRLGKVLWDCLDMIPGDSGSPEVWNFLSLVVLPNTCNARYSISSVDGLNKHIGEIRRVYLKSLWVRRRIYGEMLDNGIDVFSDDLHFQLTDRVVTRTCPVLCHVVIDVLSRTPNPNRAFYRRLLREIQAVASYVPFGLLSQSESASLVHGLAVYVADELDVKPPQQSSSVIVGEFAPPSIGLREDICDIDASTVLKETPVVAQEQNLASPKAPAVSKPSELRGRFEGFKASSDLASAEAQARRVKIQDRAPAEKELSTEYGASTTSVVSSKVDMENIERSNPDDVNLVNSFTLRTWRKIYNKLLFRDLLDDVAVVAFESFLESKKATDPRTSTLMLRCMATALDKGIMKHDDLMPKIKR